MFCFLILKDITCMLPYQQNENKTLNFKHSDSEPVYSQTKSTAKEAQQMIKKRLGSKRCNIEKILVKHDKVIDGAIFTLH